MTKSSRLLLLLGSVLLLGVFVLPLWRIELTAPQYPEGLGMLIRINTVTGVRPTDLGNINGLNHYIGMKVIEPNAIPELRFMPWIVASLAAFGAIGALVGRRALLKTWLVALIALAVVGLADFWRWGYEYGHELDEHAIIQVPGMTYQPPLLGTKQLLNITASSWPAAGAIVLGVAFGLGVVALLITRRSPRPSVRGAAAVALAATACAAPGPRTIAYDRDTCDYCHMTISDRRFGAQLVTHKGKTHAFDSIECLVAFMLQEAPDTTRSMIWVADYANPGAWTRADQASFARSTARRSPMGLGIIGFSGQQPPAPLDGGQLLPMKWGEVVALAQRERLGATMDRETDRAAH
jgi:copper chaperone NosL